MTPISMGYLNYMPFNPQLTPQQNTDGNKVSFQSLCRN